MAETQPVSSKKPDVSPKPTTPRRSSTQKVYQEEVARLQAQLDVQSALNEQAAKTQAAQAQEAKKTAKKDKTRTIIVKGLEGNLREWQRNRPASEEPSVRSAYIEAFLRIHDALPPGKLQDIFGRLEGAVKAKATMEDAGSRVTDFVLQIAKPFIAAIAPEKGTGLVSGVPDKFIQRVKSTAINWGSKALEWTIKTSTGLSDKELPFGERIKRIFRKIVNPMSQEEPGVVQDNEPGVIPTTSPKIERPAESQTQPDVIVVASAKPA